jgi:hypothetical protein
MQCVAADLPADERYGRALFATNERFGVANGTPWFRERGPLFVQD